MVIDSLIAAWAAASLDLIPFIGSLAKKITEDTVVSLIERKEKKELKWFYLLQEMVPMRWQKYPYL